MVVFARFYHLKLLHSRPSKNSESSLPHSFADLTTLQWLDLSDNPWAPEFAPIAVQQTKDSGSEDAERCARRVVKYMEDQRARAELQRQIEGLERKKQREARRAAEAQAKAEQR